MHTLAHNIIGFNFKEKRLLYTLRKLTRERYIYRVFSTGVCRLICIYIQHLIYINEKDREKETIHNRIPEFITRGRPLLLIWTFFPISSRVCVCI